MALNPAALRFAAALLAASPLLASCSRGEHEDAPKSRELWNIVIVTLDALRYDHLHCYGYPRETTPHLDRVAARGLLFEHAVAQWPKTGPSMASMMTSTYGSTNGVKETFCQKIPRAYDLLAEILHGAGYQNFGVMANLSLSPKMNFDQGFDEGCFVVSTAVDAKSITAQAKGLFGKRDPSRPFFLWVHYLDPHAPYAPPPGYGEEFGSDPIFVSDRRPKIPVDPRVKDPGAAVVENNEIGFIPAYTYLPGKDELRDYVAKYDGDIRFTDEHVGDLLDWMGAQGALEHTIVVVTSDHGESLGDHNYYFEHGRFPYDDCLRVPLIIVHPGWNPARIAAPVALLDVAPTLLEWTGLAPGWQFEGHSLAKWLSGGAREQPRPVFSESGYHKQFEVSVCKGRYKLIRVGTHYMTGLLTGKPYELYDVVADPGETKNLVDVKPDVAEELRDLLDAHAEAAWVRAPPPEDGEAYTPNAHEKEQIDKLGYGKDKERAKQAEEAEEAEKARRAQKTKDGGGG